MKKLKKLFLNELNIKDHSKRDFRRIKGNVQLMNNDEDTVPGPYLKKTREEILINLNAKMSQIDIL